MLRTHTELPEWIERIVASAEKPRRQDEAIETTRRRPRRARRSVFFFLRKLGEYALIGAGAIVLGLILLTALSPLANLPVFSTVPGFVMVYVPIAGFLGGMVVLGFLLERILRFIRVSEDGPVQKVVGITLGALWLATFIYLLFGHWIPLWIEGIR